MNSFDMELDRGMVCVTYAIDGREIDYLKVEAYVPRSRGHEPDLLDITEQLSATERDLVIEAVWTTEDWQ